MILACSSGGGRLKDVKVQSYPSPGDADSVVVRWGDAGREHTVKVEDDQAIMKAWKSAVAEGLAGGEHVEDETDRSVAREVQDTHGIRVAKDTSGGLIIAYWPDEAVATVLSALVAGVEGAVALNDLHLTLLYLDDSEGIERNEWDIELVAAVTKLFSTRWSPREAAITGLGRFVGPEDEDVVVALIDSPRLAAMRTQLKEELCYSGRVPSGARFWDEEHGFIPHVTLAYVPKAAETPKPPPAIIEFEIDNIAIARGSARVVYDLEDYEQEMESMAEPVYRARRSLEKAGRVLSGQNLAAVEDAIEQLTALAEQERARGVEPEISEEETEKRATFFKTVAGEDYGDGIEYIVTKASSEEDRYTFGPLYAPERLDIHGEYVDADMLQKATWDFVRASAAAGRRINLQHGDLGAITVAEWVDVVAWPYDHTITVKTVGGEERELDMPAGTVYVGAVWDEDAWPLVKTGKLNGWSLGGRAVKVSGKDADALAAMGDTKEGALKKRKWYGRGRTRKDSSSDYEQDDGGASTRLLAKFAEAAVEENQRMREEERDRAEQAIAAIRSESQLDRAQVVKMLDVVRESIDKLAQPTPQPDLHVHLPEMNPTVNVAPAEVNLDVVE